MLLNFVNLTWNNVWSFSTTENGPVIYTSEKEGNDDSGDGTVQKPFKTLLQV